MGSGFVYVDTSDKTLGLKRNLKFWVRAFPMYLHYRVTEELVKGKTDEVCVCVCVCVCICEYV